MDQRNKQLWIVKYRHKGRLSHRVSPPFAHAWEAMWWLKQLKPLAVDITVESHRPMALPKQ